VGGDPVMGSMRVMAGREGRTRSPALRRLARMDPVTLVVASATIVFVLAGIGSPLLGLSVFADTGSLARYSGYRDVLAGVHEHTVDLRDQVDSGMPTSILFGERLRSGDFAAWNPYPVGGEMLGSTTNAALASPLSLPYWFLPGWLAPGYIHLLELVCAIGGTYLFLRRLRLGPAAAWLGGLGFASSAFMIVWTGWPQTRVAALVPIMFWAIEGLVSRVRLREVVLIALAVAGMLLGGFPAVTGYAVLSASAYLLVRLGAEHGRAWRPILARIGAATAGLVVGIGLAAWQLVPWARRMAGVLVLGRAQDPSSHIPGEALVTAIAPYALGTVNPDRPPDWFGGLRLLDADAYVGAAVLVLVFTAIALARPARALLPRGVWWTLVASSAVWTAAIFFGGPVLFALQRLPFLFSDNFVGRARSVLGFLLAVLAAVGFEVIRTNARTRERTASRRGRWYGVAVWAALAVAGIVAYVAARAVTARPSRDRVLGEPDLLAHLHRELAVGLILLLVAAACVAWLWFARGTDRSRVVATGTIVLLVAGQALWFARTYHPRTDREHFYPTTPTQTYLAAHLGHQRYYGADGAIFGSVDVTARLRSFHGHSMIWHTFADLAAALPGEQFFVPPTAIISDPLGGVVARSPVLDRAAVSHYVVPPEVRPFGQVHLGQGDGATVTLRPGRTVSTPVPVAGPVRGLGLIPVSPLDGAAAMPAVSIVLRDASGAEVAHGERHAAIEDRPGYDDPEDPWTVAVPAETVARDSRLTAEITVHGSEPVIVAAAGAGPALTVVTPADDGLRLVYAAETVIYERIRALPRARWATSAVVEPDPAARVQLVASGALRSDQVVLDRPGSVPDGGSADVTWVEDGQDEMTLAVRAEGSGYLVLADAIQDGWRVTVDGSPATPVHADHAFIAVALGPGDHTVRWSYRWPWADPGVWITLVTASVLLTGLGFAAWRLRGRRRLD
jgi:hypothetical protein